MVWIVVHSVSFLDRICMARTIFLLFSSAASHSLPMYTALRPKARTRTPRETRPITRRLRSTDDKESFDDFAPVLCLSSAGSVGEKSRLGTPHVGGDGSGGDSEISGSFSNEPGGGGGFWDIHRTVCEIARRGTDRDRTANMMMRCGPGPSRIPASKNFYRV